MEIKFFNSLGRKLETFKPLKTGEVKIYSCGPTVYNYAHIGNLRAYIFADILHRTLKFNSYKVKHVMNITDVGHLASDADEGEDKMSLASKKEKKSPEEIANFYIEAFHKDLDKLNIFFPSKEPRATEHIKDMLKLIEKLEKKGYTYEAGGNIYFNTAKFKNYNKLSNANIEEAKSRVEQDTNKKNKQDFVLWFTKSKFGNQEQKWESKYGEGYPGWHIECSAMSMKYLGEKFDIHTGGIDHIPIHHTNEIAQSEAATGKKWVKYWMHNEFLVTDKKMSKSKGDFLTLSKLKEMGYDPLDYRYFCLTSSYRKQLQFSLGAMDAAKASREKLVERIKELKRKKDSNLFKNSYLKRFNEEINEDLNTPKALATLIEVLKHKKLGSKEKIKFAYSFDKVLGLGLKDIKIEKVPLEIREIAIERAEARKNQDWEKSDKLRREMVNRGFTIKDTKDKYEITRIINNQD
jgi:cysteinyl-tRNA synthetase